MEGFILSRVTELRNEVVLGNISEQCLDLDASRMGRNTVKKAVFPLDGRSGSFKKMFVKRKQKLRPICLSQSNVNSTCSGEGDNAVAGTNIEISKGEDASKTDSNRNFDVVYDGNGSNGKFTNSEDIYGGDGNNGNFTNGRGGGGGDEGDEVGKGDEKDEFGPLLKFEEVMKEMDARGATLPSDMIEAAKSVGIRKLLLHRYFDLQGSSRLVGFLMGSCSIFRNRMLADPTFLFKIGTEIVIDSCCATVAEVQKRGKDFWAEFELYLADLLVGLVVNVALVGMLAPYARIGKPSIPKGFFGRLGQAYGALPSSVFEAERPGCRFSVNQRIASYFYKGVIYVFVGFSCGIIGQGIANLIMTAKRNMKKSEGDIPVPPLLKSAALWGVFLAVSSNTRYQVVNGLERLVETSPLAKHLPLVAMAFTVSVRYANNVYGGMQFVDWARWSGVQ